MGDLASFMIYLGSFYRSGIWLKEAGNHWAWFLNTIVYTEILFTHKSCNFVTFATAEIDTTEH